MKMKICEQAGIIPPKECLGYMALYQHKPWWNRPFFGKNLCEIPDRTQLLLIQKSENAFELYLAFCGDDFRTDIKGTAEGIGINGPYVHAEGDDPYRMVQEALRLVAERLGHPLLRKDKIFPEIFRYPGWCTWDSLGKGVCEQAIFDKMDELNEKGARIGWVLIDDGWSEADRELEKLRSLDVDYERFPQGLAHTVKALKEKYGVKYVGVWQAFNGYWGGVEEGSAAYRDLEGCLKTYAGGQITVNDTAEDSFAFWNTWHRSLAAQGVDFVKIDNQSSFPGLYQEGDPVGERLKAIYEGLEASVLLNFNGNLINCMGMAADNVWTRGRTSLSRSSDDYLPRTAGSFGEHALQNAFNSLYQGELYFGDWDMFWTEHEDAKQSAILRAISGGPVYISDACGKTDPSLLERFLDRDGRLLMCDDVGRPTRDCLAEDFLGKGGILKIFNHCGDNILVACFTMEADRERSVEGVIDLRDIAGVDGEYLIYNSDTNEIASLDKAAPYRFTMRTHDALMLQLIPKKTISVIGFADKWLPAAGVQRTDLPDGSLLLSVSCAGNLQLVSDEDLIISGLSGKPVQYTRNGSRYEVMAEEGLLQVSLQETL